MVDSNSLVGSLLVLLNDSSKLARPVSDYSGSFFFGPNQEIVYRNNLPKGRITPGENFNDEKTFGNGFKTSKHFNIQIDFFTMNNFVDSNGLKNSELVSFYMEEIEEVIKNNTSYYGGAVIEEMSDIVEPQRADDKGNNLWVARKVLVFKRRR